MGNPLLVCRPLPQQDGHCFQVLPGEEGALNIGRHWGDVTPAATIFIDLRKGVIFFGDMGDHSDWFVLGLRRGKAEMQISSVMTNISVRGGQRLDDGHWHRMLVMNEGDSVRLEVDGDELLTLGHVSICWGRVPRSPPVNLPPVFAPPDLAGGAAPPNGSWGLAVELGLRAPRQTGLVLAVGAPDGTLVLTLALQPTALVARLGNRTELRLPLPEGPCLDAPLRLQVSPTQLALRLGDHGDTLPGQPPDFQWLQGAWLGQEGRLFIGGLPEGGQTPRPQEWGAFQGCLQGIRVQGHQLDLDSALFRSDSIWAHSCPGGHEAAAGGS
ncbi:NADH:ubiquinone oxidoreductase subunit M [Platysternon megacephalum]|uniref:NADH:ubiquinone oxidoreductase subunit M n=1 Tax=Platysternon megacephalum TaxID=55544 RepID=A0A4D9DG84_9SAUR|nr:NADH:ubiquinone oxidoreductase subunit M [Platysternon megacephalum]